MAPPERTSKRQKLSPADTPSSSGSSAQASSTTGQPQNGAPSRSSWYSRTWPRKAAPVTQIARESISSASNTAIETASVIKDKIGDAANTSRKSSLALTLGKGTSNKALPVGATTTTDHAMPEDRKSSKQDVPRRLSTRRSTTTEATPLTPSKEPEPEPRPDSPLNKAVGVGAQSAQETESPGVRDAPMADKTKQPATEQRDTKQETATPRSWIGWLSGKEDSAANSISQPKEDQIQQEDPPATPQPVEDKQSDPAPVASDAKKPPDQPLPTNQRRGWLPIWNNATAAQSVPTISSSAQDADVDAQRSLPLKPAIENSTTDQKSVKADDPPAQTDTIVSGSQPAAKPSAWIFWSRERPVETASSNDTRQEGEIAVANTASETHPRRASVSGNTVPKVDASPAQPTEDTQPNTVAKKKQEAKSSKEPTRRDSKASKKTTKAQSKGATATAIAPSELESSRPASPAPPKKNYEHILSPSFHETLKLPEYPTLLQQLSRLFYPAKEPDLKHLHLIKDPPKIKNALAIGVHGYFPAPLIRSVLGQPTGTSIKFADMAAKSIQRWTKNKGYECQVKTAALEGEGKIAERIALLWKLLLNWIDEIRKADFVMVACHSQGVPVAVMLVAKLIHFGCINAARVGICAMAGVNLGPFPEFKSRWMSGSAGELFEFSDTTSKVSTDYIAALEDVVKFGVKLTYVGSIDDQLVSLESSIFAPVSHPHIYRAVSIDSRLHAPDFVSHLVAFALKLRNLGVQDHGLIRELSAPLAGSLYTGEGHSRLYEDSAIYDLAVSFALETSSMPGLPLSQRPIPLSSSGNPYILPFAMRGILEEDFVKLDLQAEVASLLRRFDEWKPTTKPLRDVKFRLEGIRSKL